MPEVLFITDFSRAGDHAVQYAAALAADIRCTLRIVYAYLIPVIISDLTTQPMPLIAVDEMKATAVGRMNELQTRLKADLPGLIIKPGIIYGDWEDAISEYTSATELIIIAGDSDDGTWLGNEMHNAALNSGKPVLVIPKGACYTGLRKICLACDAAAMGNMRPLISILPLLKSAGTTLELLHIHTGTNDTTKWNESGLATVLQGLSYSLHEKETEAETIDQKIHAFAVSSGADWLALMPHHYSFFQGLFHKSHTKAAFKMGDFPVLCLH